MTHSSSGYKKANSFPNLWTKSEVAIEEMHSLCQDANPIDAVDWAQIVLLHIVAVHEAVFYWHIKIIRTPIHSKYVNIICPNRRHLQLLKGVAISLGKQNDNVNPFKAFHALYGSTACVPRGANKDHHVPVALAQEEVHQLGQSSQCQVLESKGLAMKKLHHMNVSNRHDGSNVRMSKARICFVQQI